ncbi:MAG: glycoside hydrolase family 15 protein [Pseudomonadota bacterium]|nr:glycoside hydrolase family 15 protein [Pseudomonadota bacterium]
MNLDLAIIGNCSYGALVDSTGDVVWACMPRFDSEPVFCSLLQGSEDEGRLARFSIDLVDAAHSKQRYLGNTAILITTLHDSHGGAIELIDFAPRFKHYGRTFRPMQLVRIVRPVAGSPRVRIRVRPSFDYGQTPPTLTHGSNHIRYVGPKNVLRLTTDGSVTAIVDERPFILEHELTMILGPDEPVTEALPELGRRFFEQTKTYWEEWVRFLAVPFEWQEEVIRAAITLKLNAYEDTGAIIAAVTTSIPEAPHTERNWDYRYCWIRDGYFVVNALSRLGATRTMEDYVDYILNVVAESSDDGLRPVYRINGKDDLEESIVAELPGYRDMGPVRIGNEAYLQVQNDVYGSAVRAAAHIFFDERIGRTGDTALFQRLEWLGEQAVRVYDKPDAGLWEFRGRNQVHTFSAVMCWSACRCLARIARRLGLHERASYWSGHAEQMANVIDANAWDAQRQTYVASFGGKDLDASLLLLYELGYLSGDDPRLASTVAAIEKDLGRGRFLFRYVQEDDFGTPSTAFTTCTYWYIDTLAALGRHAEARELFENLLACRNHVGLLSEDVDPASHELWGNFPQTYSMVGLINSAMRLSKGWEDAF